MEHFLKASHSVTSTLSPIQLNPPFSGAGLLHSLVLDLCPCPHVTLQYDHFDQLLHCPSTGHDKIKQFSDSVPSLSWHWIPPNSAGFAIDLVRIFCPVPHVCEHSDQFVQVDHWQF